MFYNNFLQASITSNFLIEQGFQKNIYANNLFLLLSLMECLSYIKSTQMSYILHKYMILYNYVLQTVFRPSSSQTNFKTVNKFFRIQTYKRQKTIMVDFKDCRAKKIIFLLSVIYT